MDERPTFKFQNLNDPGEPTKTGQNYSNLFLGALTAIETFLLAINERLEDFLEPLNSGAIVSHHVTVVNDMSSIVIDKNQHLLLYFLFYLPHNAAPRHNLHNCHLPSPSNYARPYRLRQCRMVLERSKIRPRPGPSGTSHRFDMLWRPLHHRKRMSEHTFQ